MYITSLIHFIASHLYSSSTLESLAIQAELIEVEVQSVLDISRKVTEECTIQSIIDNIETNRSKIVMLSHQLCLVTKVKLKHCQGQLHTIRVVCVFPS